MIHTTVTYKKKSLANVGISTFTRLFQMVRVKGLEPLACAFVVPHQTLVPQGVFLKVAQRVSHPSV